MVTSRALELSIGVASIRPRQRINSVIRRLEAHAENPAVAEALEMARG